jgi:hypothetical protein
VVKFIAFYGSNGWKVGRNPMKDWRRAMDGWKARWKDNGNRSGPAGSGAQHSLLPAWQQRKDAENEIAALTAQARYLPEGAERNAKIARIQELQSKLVTAQ